jgi:hypothetical protein
MALVSKTLPPILVPAISLVACKGTVKASSQRLLVPPYFFAFGQLDTHKANFAPLVLGVFYDS